jgi:ubiquinone/menaquinone biosynthesis C-methylase UbiE
MASAYDNFDYPAYWQDREYEHESEVAAIRKLLNEIPKISKIADVGCGYGRLTPYYIHRAKSVTLIDPCSRLLGMAKRKQEKKNGQKKGAKIKFVQSTILNIPKKIRKNQFDLVFLIRVMHHIDDPATALGVISGLIKPGGYLIIEYPNKIHWKALVNNFLKGNFTFPIDIFPSDKRSSKNIKNKTIPFLNFHPDKIKEILAKNNFSVVEKLSVSNIRSGMCKGNLPLPLMLWMEKKLQPILAPVNFGPSIIILAKKKG